MKRILLVILLGVLLVGCDQQSPLILVIRDTYGKSLVGRVETLPVSEEMPITIHAESKEASISRLTIAYSDKSTRMMSLLDTLYSGKSTLDDEWIYSPVYYQDTTLVRLRFVVYNTQGQQKEQEIMVNVLPTNDKPIRKAEKVSLYSLASKKECVFNMHTLSTTFIGAEPDSLYNIYDGAQKDDEQADRLSRYWQTSEGLFLAKAGNFDYGNATVASIMTVYSFASHSRTISNIQQNDIILVGTQTEAIGAIKVVALWDEEGTENDRYLLDVKCFLAE